MSRLTPFCLSKGHISAGPPDCSQYTFHLQVKRTASRPQQDPWSVTHIYKHALLPCPVLPPEQGGRPHVHDSPLRRTSVSSVSAFSVQLYFHLLSLTVRQSHPFFFFIDNRFSEMSSLLFLFFNGHVIAQQHHKQLPSCPWPCRRCFFFFQVGLSFSTCSEKSFNFTSLETVLALLRIKGGTELN